jgi:predicted metal-dependent hydrolase
MAKDKNYTKFTVEAEEVVDADGNTVELSIDYTAPDVAIVDAKKDTQLDLTKPEFKKLRKQTRVPKQKVKTKKVKQLRNKKGQFLSFADSQIVRKIAKDNKISIAKAKDVFATKKFSSKRSLDIQQHSILDAVKRGLDFKDNKVGNPNAIIRVKDSSGRKYTFTGKNAYKEAVKLINQENSKLYSISYLDGRKKL